MGLIKQGGAMLSMRQLYCSLDHVVNTWQVSQQGQTRWGLPVTLQCAKLISDAQMLKCLAVMQRQRGGMPLPRSCSSWSGQGP